MRPGHCGQKRQACGRGVQMHMTPVRCRPDRIHQLLAGQMPDQIAGSRLMDVHGSGQFRDPHARVLMYDTECPYLRTADACLPLDLLEMGSHCIEDDAKLPQHMSGLDSRIRVQGGVFDGERVVLSCEHDAVVGGQRALMMPQLAPADSCCS